VNLSYHWYKHRWFIDSTQSGPVAKVAPDVVLSVELGGPCAAKSRLLALQLDP
jgi:hypothetical protein